MGRGREHRVRWHDERPWNPFVVSTPVTGSKAAARPAPRLHKAWRGWAWVSIGVVLTVVAALVALGASGRFPAAAGCGGPGPA